MTAPLTQGSLGHTNYTVVGTGVPDGPYSNLLYINYTVVGETFGLPLAVKDRPYKHGLKCFAVL